MSDIGIDFDGLIFWIIVGPTVLFAIIGGILQSNRKIKAAKVFFIMSFIYVIICLAIYASLII